jgi:hypothetical protein
MSIFKKYKLWWLLSSAVLWFMAGNLLMFGVLGFSFIPVTSGAHMGALAFITVVSALFTGFGWDGGTHVKE